MFLLLPNGNKNPSPPPFSKGDEGGSSISAFQSLNSFDQRRMGIVKPCIKRIGNQIGQVVRGQSLKCIAHRFCCFRQLQDEIVCFALKPSGNGRLQRLSKVAQGAEKGSDQKYSNINRGLRKSK